MSSIENIVKFNAQTVGREKLIRLCQYTTKFLNAVLFNYYTKYAKGGHGLIEFIYRLRELEQYFISCRRMLSFGRCIDQFYLALKSAQIYDPVLKTTLFTSKFWLSFHLFADHIVCLNQIGFLKVEKQRWVERANKFLLYSVSLNLLRDIYELVCVIQQKRIRDKDNLDNELKKFTLSTPLKWARKYPKLSCDLIKNFCDFWIPYSSINKVDLNPIIISSLGIISTTMGILQVYDKNCRFSPN